MAGRSKADIKEVFTLHDKQREGRVPVEKLGHMLRCLDLNPTNQDVNRICQKVLGGRPHFSLSDLEKCVDVASGSCFSANDLKDAFKVFDRDASGFINAADIRHVLTSLGERLTEQELDDMFRVIEVDSEGNICIDEVTPKMASNPARR